MFLHSGFYSWLYTGNIFFCAAVVLNAWNNYLTNAKLTAPAITSRGTRLSITASVISLAGSALLCVMNYYLFPDQRMEYSSLLKGNATTFAGIKTINEFIVITFANSFLINFVCGSLSSFFVAGIVNEKNYASGSKPLSSVDH